MDSDWMHLATAAAATSSGREHLQRERLEAAEAGQDAAVARLDTALAGGALLLSAAAARDAERRRALTTRPRSPLREELEECATQFGADPEQVSRDHAISHVLAALADLPGAGDGSGDLVFIGGTALARTLLPTLRLSEDVDLVTSVPRREVAERIEGVLRRRLRRTHGGFSWLGPSLADVDAVEPAVASIGRVNVRFQLLPGSRYPRWPLQVRRLHQRYSDAPPASLTSLSTAGFVVSKLSAWHDRRSPRDLYDLWALGVVGGFTPEAVHLQRRLGPTGGSLPAFVPPPSEDAWTAALAHQGRVQVSAAVAAREVGEMWGRAVRAADRPSSTDHRP
jgi:hypothetical protein